MAGSDYISRREAVRRGGTLAAGMVLVPADLARRLEAIAPQEAVIPWTNAPAAGGRANTLDWQALTSWVTPNEDLFGVGHYGTPEIDADAWALELTGLVERPRTLTLDEIRSRPRRSVTCVIECAGNRGFATFMGAVHNATWTGTPLAPLLDEVGVQAEGIEVVFFGADQGTEEIRDIQVTQNFARSMSIDEVRAEDLLLAYEVNGAPLPTANGFPLRLVAPGWYGVAHVKWLERIEVRDRRFMGRFMARDYVTLRQEGPDTDAVWAETLVGRMNVNSIPAKVVRQGTAYRIHGAAWGADLDRVEVRVDDGPWRPAALGEGRDDPHTWTFWQMDWDAEPGQHAVTSRAVSTSGEVQPAQDDPILVQKITYWESNGQVTREIVIE